MKCTMRLSAAAVIACVVAGAMLRVQALGDPTDADPAPVRKEKADKAGAGEKAGEHGGAGGQAGYTGSGSVKQSAGKWRMTLIDRDARVEPVEVVRLTATTVVGGKAGKSELVYIDAKGQKQTRGIDEVLALGPIGWSEGERAGREEVYTQAKGEGGGDRVLELVDGQLFVGGLEHGGAAGGVDEVAWKAGRFGVLSVPLERVGVLGSVGRSLGVWGAPVQDRLVLRNGDVLDGMIERLGEQVVFSAGKSAKNAVKTSVPLENVQEARLANPAEAASGMMLWLSDGTAVGVAELVSEIDGVRLRARAALAKEPGQGAQVLSSEIVGVSFHAGLVRGVGGMKFEAVKAEAERAWTDAPMAIGSVGESVFGAPDVAISGPMSFEVELPEGARWVLASARMPEDAWVWGDCELVVSQVDVGEGATAGKELSRSRLNVSTPTARIAVKLEGQRPRLRVSVIGGASGPIQDRVVIEHGVVVIGTD